MKKNGEPKWARPYSQVVVSNAELIAQQELYEREHDRCRVCYGTGNSWSGWSITNGNRYELCRRCSGTGRPIRSDAAVARANEK